MYFFLIQYSFARKLLSKILLILRLLSICFSPFVRDMLKTGMRRSHTMSVTELSVSIFEGESFCQHCFSSMNRNVVISYWRKAVSLDLIFLDVIRIHLWDVTNDFNLLFPLSDPSSLKYLMGKFYCEWSFLLSMPTRCHKDNE